jgi:hypothetical protein
MFSECKGTAIFYVPKKFHKMKRMKFISQSHKKYEGFALSYPEKRCFSFNVFQGKTERKVLLLLLVTLRAFWGDCYNSELQIDYLLEKEPMVREAFILAS